MKRLLITIGNKSKKAFQHSLDTKKKNQVLKDYFLLIKKNKNVIINQNKKDIINANKIRLKENLKQRLILNEKKVFEIIKSIKEIIKIKDPTNIILEKLKRPNGLNISKVTIH